MARLPLPTPRTKQEDIDRMKGEIQQGIDHLKSIVITIQSIIDHIPDWMSATENDLREMERIAQHRLQDLNELYRSEHLMTHYLISGAGVGRRRF